MVVAHAAEEASVPPARMSAAIPARTFKEMSATIFLRRLWKIPQLTTSIRPPNLHVNNFWDTKATIATLRASAAENGLPRSFMIARWASCAEMFGVNATLRRRWDGDSA